MLHTAEPPLADQPSLEETRAAIRLAQILAVTALALFFALSFGYRIASPMVAAGRSSGATWNLYKAALLRAADAGGELRAQPEAPILWLVGSSVIREGFDERGINNDLTASGSAWRVAKLGQTRGGTGLTVGLLRELPLRAGDLVLHDVTVADFRRNWVRYFGIDEARVQALLTLPEIWSIAEWSWQDKVEATVAVPRDFYRFHDDHMGGVLRWLRSPWIGMPEPREGSFHVGVRYRATKVTRDLRWARSLGPRSRLYFHGRDLDFGPRQFNVAGLRRMRELCRARGARLILADVQPRRERQEDFLDQAGRDAWARWARAQPDLHSFPQLPERYYYDLKHPNVLGRRALSDYLVQWIRGGFRDRRTEMRDALRGL